MSLWVIAVIAVIQGLKLVWISDDRLKILIL